MNETRQISKIAKQEDAVAWGLMSIAFLAHACLLLVLTSAAGWLFGNSPTVIGVTCTAYLSAVIGWAVDRVKRKVTRMAVHATSVHDEVLLVKELIQEEQRRSVQPI